MDESSAAGVFGRHMVAMVFASPDWPEPFVATTFVLEEEPEKWVLVTAGHVLEQLDEVLRASGPSGVICRLLDGFGLKSRYSTTSVPFDYLGADKHVFGDDQGRDFACVSLNELSRKLLKRNGVHALGYDAWLHSPDEIQHSGYMYFLVGFPSERVHGPRYDASGDPELNLWLTVHSLRISTSLPDVLLGKSNPRLYFHVATDADVRSVRGMSGGPVFALRAGDGGKYWLAGVQSSWAAQRQ